MFIGGVVRWRAERALSAHDRESVESDSGPGVLFSSGLIAGGAITGVILAALTAKHVSEHIDLSGALGAFSQSRIVAALVYLLAIATPLYLIAKRGTATKEIAP